MKPYTDSARLTQEKREFNLKFGELLSAVERAFGMLKARWRIALKGFEQKTSTLKKTVIAVCVLHNVCMKGMTMARITTMQMTVLTTTAMEELGWEYLLQTRFTFLKITF